MNMYPQMETPGGTCTPKQKYEWACWARASLLLGGGFLLSIQAAVFDTQVVWSIL